MVRNGRSTLPFGRAVGRRPSSGAARPCPLAHGLQPDQRGYVRRSTHVQTRLGWQSCQRQAVRSQWSCRSRLQHRPARAALHRDRAGHRQSRPGASGRDPADRASRSRRYCPVASPSGRHQDKADDPSGPTPYLHKYDPLRHQHRLAHHAADRGAGSRPLSIPVRSR